MCTRGASPPRVAIETTASAGGCGTATSKATRSRTSSNPLEIFGEARLVLPQLEPLAGGRVAGQPGLALSQERSTPTATPDRLFRF